MLDSSGASLVGFFLIKGEDLETLQVQKNGVSFEVI